MNIYTNKLDGYINNNTSTLFVFTSFFPTIMTLTYPWETITSKLIVPITMDNPLYNTCLTFTIAYPAPATLEPRALKLGIKHLKDGHSCLVSYHIMPYTGKEPEAGSVLLKVKKGRNLDRAVSATIPMNIC